MYPKAAHYLFSFSKCIHLLASFEHQNHVCLVSELLGMCLYDFMRQNNHLPFPRHHVQELARQLLGSVACKPDDVVAM